MMLRYLATGSFLLAISDFVGVSESSACRYIHQTCRAIAKQKQKFLSFPINDVDIKTVITGFYSRSRFPRVIGAIDCTHIKIQSPGINKIYNYCCQLYSFLCNYDSMYLF